jgi:hypothetical protein
MLSPLCNFSVGFLLWEIVHAVKELITVICRMNLKLGKMMRLTRVPLRRYFQLFATVIYYNYFCFVIVGKHHPMVELLNN